MKASSGPDDPSPEPSASPESIQLRTEVSRLQARVEAQAKEITRWQELAGTDPLTGIANRRSFDRELRRRHAEQLRDGRGFCLMIMDIDRFKSVNDTFGHAAGDRLLQSLARILESNVRAGDIVFRIGGDEWAVILPGARLDLARHAARRLVELTRQTIPADEQTRSVGLSIGLVESTGQGTLEDLVRAADRAMYRAKQQGGNRCLTEDPAASATDDRSDSQQREA